MQHILWEGDTPYGHYQVADTTYDGRPARVLYSGDQQAAQSGLPQDDKPDMLFDYNQRFLELAIGLDSKRILLIGGGVCTLPAMLLAKLPSAVIDVVELDPELIELAEKFFALPANDRLGVYITDGRTFLREHSERYDMILVDVYNHTAIPWDVKTLQAFEAYQKHLGSKGVFAMNVIGSYYGSGIRPLHEVYAAATRTFDTVDVFLAAHGYSLWLPQNFVLTAQKGQSLSLSEYVRYGTVLPPEVSPESALED